MSRRVQRLICKNLINKSGITVLLKRPAGNIQLDKYGEPIDGDVFIENSREITIVVIRDKREVEETLIGGLPNNSAKEILSFYCSGSEDVKTGDKILYPPQTPNEWIVYYLEPTVLNGTNIVTEARCYRDPRY
jgi:hypothetical protein